MGNLDFFDALILLNIALKLCGVIDWPWYKVLWPIAAAFVMVLLKHKGGNDED